MKVFVTGGAGYIGSVSVEALLEAGHEVVVFDNLSEGHLAAIDKRAEFILGDLRIKSDIHSALAKARPDAVMHFAANALVGESMLNPSKYYENNVCGGINLLSGMVESGCKRIVFSSTCASFGIPEKIPIDERTPQIPINVYGHSKLIFEHILKWYEQVHGFVFVALRYFNASGASEKFGEDHRPESHLIPCVLKVALGQSEKVTVFGDKYPTPDGTCIRDFIHIVDLAQAHVLALGRGQSAHYNIGTGEGYSVLQVIEACKKVTGKSIPFDIVQGRAGDPPRLVASAHKIRAELGWRPRYARMQEIVESAWNWHVKNPEGYAE